MAEAKKTSTNTIDKMNILQRINGVMGEIKYVKKTKQVGYGNAAYMAVTHDEVTKSLHPLLVKYGIVVLPELIDERVVETGTLTSGGTPIIRCEAKYKVLFVSISDKDDFASVVVSAHANDHGDKAPGKALSYAVKNAKLKVFDLETGEDEEERIEEHPGPLTGTQLEALQIYTDELGFPVDETLDSLAQRVYRVDSSDQIPSAAYNDARRRLKKKFDDAQRNKKKKPETQKPQKQKPEPQKEEDPFGGE